MVQPIDPADFPGLQGSPWGALDPPKRRIPYPSKDPRTLALERLADYVALLTFYRPANDPKTKESCPAPFQVKRDEFFVDQPDYEQDLPFPSIVCINEQPAEYRASLGMVPWMEESSRDKFAPGTALVVKAEHVELISLESWTAEKATRRAIIAGLQQALSPTEERYGLLLRVPDYYGQVARFTPTKLQPAVEDEAVRNRRKMRLQFELSFPVVELVQVYPLIPLPSVCTLAPCEQDCDLGAPCDELPVCT